MPESACVGVAVPAGYGYGAMSLFADFTARYSPSEAWFYDRFIAPAAADLGESVLGQLLEVVVSGAEVLEVGCGGGQLAEQVGARRGDLRWLGVDVSAEQVARARRRHAGSSSAEFVVGDALDLPFEDERFDAVVSVASIKHWPDPAAGLAECVRVLRPGGVLLVVEADRGCRFDDARRFVSRWRLPALTRPLNLLFFRTMVAGRSLDLDDARGLMESLPLASWHVSRLPGTPALVMLGERRSRVA